MSQLQQPNGTIKPTHISSLQQPLPELPTQIKTQLKNQRFFWNLIAGVAFCRFGFVGFFLSNFFSCNWWWNSTTERLMTSVLTDWETDIVLGSDHLRFGGLSATPLKAPLWSNSSTANCPSPPMSVIGDSWQHLYLGKKCGFGFLYWRRFDLVWKCLGMAIFSRPA